MLPLVLAARRFFEASPLARERLSKGCLIAKGLQREGLTVWRFVRVDGFVIVIFRGGESWMWCCSNLSCVIEMLRSEEKLENRKLVS